MSFSRKGKGKALDVADSSYDDSDTEITQEYLDSLLEKARQSVRSREGREEENEDVIHLGEGSSQKPLPSLAPSKLPPPYIQLGAKRDTRSAIAYDPDSVRIAKVDMAQSTPAPPPPPPELSNSGKALTKKQIKAMKQVTAGRDWFDLPAPAEADLPRLYREVEALRLRNQLDPKRFYKKDEGEGKGIKGLPKFFGIGKILPTETPFGTTSSDNLAKSQRKRTLVDELVDDSEAKRYAKRKFLELQGARAAKGKNTLAQKQELRKKKW